MKQVENWRSDNLRVRKLKESGSQLIFSDVAREYLESFRRSERISKRASKHIIDIANTSTLLDKSNQIDSEHIIEAMQCRLFDRYGMGYCCI